MAEIPIFDPAGRPSCGPSSAFYGSGYEAAWVDSDGRPSIGPGSADWWAKDGSEGYRFDHRGTPSCGPGSRTYGSEPKAPQVVTQVASLTQANTGFVAASASGGYVTRAHSTGPSAWLEITTTGTAAARNISVQWTLHDPYGFPSSRALPAQIIVAGLIPPGGPTSYTVPIPSIPIGMTGELTVFYEAFVPAGETVDIAAVIPNTSAEVGPNAGAFPDLDTAGRPSCGPNSGHYLDVTPIVDGLGRPSCGAGSGDYLAGGGVADWLGRPSCGAGSAFAFSAPAIPAPGWVNGPQGTCGNEGGMTWTFTIDARQIALLPRVQFFAGMVVGVASPFFGGEVENVASWTFSSPTAEILSYPKSVPGGGGTGSVALAPITDVTDDGFYGSTSTGLYFYRSAAVPQLPVDANACGPVTIRISVTVTAAFDSDAFSCPPVAAIFGMSFGAVLRAEAPDFGPAIVRGPLVGVAAHPGPNGGVEPTCVAGPNNGVDVSCVGPNGGLDVECGGIDASCGACVPGPNGGLDRVPVTECVTVSSFAPAVLVGGWPGVWATPDRPHPASCAASSLATEGGARLDGLVAPTGHLSWYVQFDVGELCAGSVVLSARLRVRAKAPKSWTLAAIDPAIGGQVYGGSVDSTLALDDEAAFYVPLDVRDVATLNAMRIIGDFATAGNEEPGWVDQIVLEVQWVGGEGCRDCGPNGPVDRNCAALTAADPEPVTAVAAWCGVLTPPQNAELVPVVRVDAGTLGVTNLRIRFFPRFNPADALPCTSAAAWERWSCMGACGEMWIPVLEAGEVLLIDGREEAVYSITGPVYRGDDRVFSDRREHGYRHLVLNCVETVVLVEVVNGGVYDPSTMLVAVDGAVRTLNGGT